MSKNFLPVKVLFLTTIFLFSTAYIANTVELNNFYKNTFYIEFATKRSFYSVNYGHVFYQGDELSCSNRIGFPIKKNSISSPRGISLITGKKSYYAELVLTLVPFIEHYKIFLSGNNISDKYLYIIPAIGYRFRPRCGGLFFKTCFAPLILTDPPSDSFWKISTQLFGYENMGIGFTF